MNNTSFRSPRQRRWLCATGGAVLALVATACTMTGVRQAPIIEKSERRDGARTAAQSAAPAIAPGSRAAQDGTYVVQRGDTLYSIALDFGQDFRDIARWNGLDDPAKLQVGQTLRVVAPEGDTTMAAASAVPVQPVGTIDTRPLASAPAPVSLPPVGGASSSGAPTAAPPGAAPAEKPASPAMPAPSASSTPPASTAPSAASAPSTSVAPTAGAAASTPAPAAASAQKPSSPAATPPIELAKAAPPKGAAKESASGWAWPVNGKVLEEFHETRNKGIDIAGNEGDPVLAASDGQVVYSGSGLRGYGNLVIIKHTDDYISAYAHNRQILVKQGQTVKRGQQIAELGKSDAEVPKLHFEIRRQGKPVDPLKYLPAR